MRTIPMASDISVYDWPLDRASDQILDATQRLLELLEMARDGDNYPLGINEPWDVLCAVENLLNQFYQVSAWRKLIAERLHVPIHISVASDDHRAEHLDKLQARVRQRITEQQGS